MISDRDLVSIQQARDLVTRASEAQRVLIEFDQARIDRVFEAMAEAAMKEIARLAELAVAETGFGIARDKTEKNRFAAEDVYRAFRKQKTVGVISETANIIEIADPRGVVAAIIPTTNPTSTAIYKILISLKARNSIVLSPHPSAARCICEAARIMREAAVREGLPPEAIGCMDGPTIEGTQELMKHRKTAIILATGGIGLVRAAYSSGKPAFGVGPGNVPAYIDRSAQVGEAVENVLIGKCFDHGTICSSEQAIVADAPIYDQVCEALKQRRAYFLSEDEIRTLERIVVMPGFTVNPKIVGRSPVKIAEAAGLAVPADTRVLIAPLTGVGKDFPLSMEKLSPILALYSVPDWRAGAEVCQRLLRFGGTGHTLAVHAGDRNVVREFSLRQPASRIVINTPSPHGSIGLTTELSPSMTLGCGSWGGNITSDNISPRHLLDIKRVAFAVRSVAEARIESAPAISGGATTPRKPEAGIRIDRSMIESLVERVLASRLERVASPPAMPVPASPHSGSSEPAPLQPPAAPAEPAGAEPVPADTTVRGRESSSPSVADFVCEEDVKRAIAEHRTILVSQKSIITPAARDLGDSKKIFVLQ
ncbi:MAG: aldehyde dehydrogenase family protein [Acidobacteria bacterium]|nr:aldehyde dehydrogenase family protein [Acidobacteriota bacterium]